ncbi:bile salt-activated lipase-like [Galleria mellonella]|uniref:Carboxylic ester hydrolase n=1 Tax=Galleria mellonella TaxID=7137 RepID=A0A6J1W991_GALME|nr:bile salt-activated lipase-like [Galleria mellonella]
MYVTMKFLFLISIFVIRHVRSNNLRLDPLVDSNAGLIRGLRASDGDYSMFLGVPFAKVNENNPFGISVPYEKFEGVYEAYDDSLMLCPQYGSSEGNVGNINCLYLNIYVPNSASTQNRVPVMAWIHGGSFATGSGRKIEFGPKYLLKQDIILVTINYRLGPYGFMCLDIPEVPGNQGLRDQLLALRWIRDNIGAFGGDISKITLFGESAGSISVDFHLLSDSENLFNRVIMESGTSLATRIMQTPDEPDKFAPIKIAEFLGFETDSVTDALNYLAQTDSNSVISAARALNMIFKPCVEQEFDNVEPFLTKHWISAKIPKARGLPILIGFNNKERLYEYVNEGPEYFEGFTLIRDKLKSMFTFDENELAELENIIHHFYMGDEKISINLIEEIAKFDTDFTYSQPIQRSIRKYMESSSGNIYYYMFSYSGGRNYNKISLNSTVEGALHADELGYLFDMPFLTEENPQDVLVLNRMTTMWANFAKYGDPTPETSDLLPVTWTPLTKDNYYYLSIDSELSLKSRPLNDRVAFWDLFYKMNNEAQKGFEEI